ncbi:hypothetical protein FB45DRAFT_541662 [Roridomyces roridus]|uniref:Uncharacterized protein n=1 Tax=Roridomyces roridus TaxID=1738132 RepID=A0AAD7FL26_9AGAR|nr:hypothetical protein FB45DRAFT_541662 [Roridomyces roridus]
MPDSPPQSPSEKTSARKKTRKLSNLFMMADTSRLVSESSDNSMPHSAPCPTESLVSIAETESQTDTRPSTSGSGRGLLTGGAPTSSKVIRPDGENIPPASPKHRKSLDLSARSVAGTSTGVIRRSNSLWVQPQRRSDEFRERYIQNFGEGTSDRQRALNVKRARKMAQVFGEEVTLSYLAIPPPLRDRANSTSTLGTEGEEDNPSTPPPVSTEHDDPESSSSFQDRRRRAAKLSRFFGVGFQDISLPPEVPPMTDTHGEVDVKVSGNGRRFWNFSAKNTDEMGEAIQKLRVMKAG